MRIYNQKIEDRLLNVYRLEDCDDTYDLEIGEEINDPAENHLEGNPHTIIVRVG